ncbi:MAG: hypothetical protein GF364_03770 [Candidatus Lokiarchaeota archaeon]|nr:hypothetical protein [Candidatus Lokiarchaeota archaeon]
MLASAQKKLFGFTAIIDVIGITLVAVIMYNLFNLGYYVNLVPAFLGIVTGTLSILIVYALDKHPNFAQRFKIQNFNLKWLLIIIISLIPTLIGSLIYFIRSQLNFNFNNFDINYFGVFDWIAFSALSALSYVLSMIVYLGLKNINPKADINKPKFTIFKVGVIILLLAIPISAITIKATLYDFPTPSVLKGYDYNDGPWLSYYNNKPNESICISWLTSQPNSSVVYYGTDSENLDKVANGQDDVYLHKVYINNLIPEQTYYYQIDEVFSQYPIHTIHNFTTASTTEQSFKFVVIGDIQPEGEIEDPTSESITATHIIADALAKEDYEFTTICGDIVDTGDDLEEWHLMFNSSAKYSANKPFMPAIGNHDTYGDNGANFASIFESPYANPEKGRYYSFDYYNVHYIMLDNFEHNGIMGDQQIDWLVNEIQTAKSRNQWVFVFFHYTIISSSDSSTYFWLQKQLIPIFDKYGVDTVFYGHDHVYEHYYYEYGQEGLVHNQYEDPSGKPIHYFMTGGAGGHLQPAIHRDTDTYIRNWWDLKTNKRVTVEIERRSWSTSNYIDHTSNPEFGQPFSLKEDPSDLDNTGKHFWQSITHKDDLSMDDMEFYGFDYGEGTLHYILVEIAGNSCTISVKYPDGSLLGGHDGTNVQQFILNK